jgi:hypothetical protein
MINEAQYEVHPMVGGSQVPQQEESPEVVEEQVPQEQQETVQEVAKKESDKEKNLKILRERAERAERERDQLMQAALRDQQQNLGPKKVSQVLEEDEEDEIGLGNDDIVEGKHLSKVQKEIRNLKKELNQYKQQSSTQTAEARLKSQYSDFDNVVTRENIDLLAHSYPELAQTLRNAPDLYTQGSAAYTLIKKFIEQPKPFEALQTERNIAKPRPSNSISPQQGDTPLSRANAFANGLTEDLKTQLIKEMNEYRKGY